MSRLARLRFVVAALAVAVLAVPGASAHEQRDLGDVRLVVGWSQEPAFVGSLNAATLHVTRGGAPVEGLAGELRLTVSLGDERTGPLDLAPVAGDPGLYEVALVPTAPGAYAFRVTGTIDDRDVDETFTAGEGTFDEVRTTAEVSFPRAAPSNAELADAVEQLRGRTGTDQAPADAASGRALALVAIAIATVALLVALVGVLRGRGHTAS